MFRTLWSMFSRWQITTVVGLVTCSSVLQTASGFGAEPTNRQRSDPRVRMERVSLDSHFGTNTTTIQDFTAFSEFCYSLSPSGFGCCPPTGTVLNASILVDARGIFRLTASSYRLGVPTIDTCEDTYDWGESPFCSDCIVTETTQNRTLKSWEIERLETVFSHFQIATEPGWWCDDTIIVDWCAFDFFRWDDNRLDALDCSYRVAAESKREVLDLLKWLSGISRTDVEIDVRPGNDRNPLNLRSRGVLPVVVWSDEAFDASTLDTESVTLAGAPVAVRAGGRKTHAVLADFDGDGDADLLLHFAVEELSLNFNTKEVVLLGRTLDGGEVVGVDSVELVPH